MRPFLLLMTLMVCACGDLSLPVRTDLPDGTGDNTRAAPVIEITLTGLNQAHPVASVRRIGGWAASPRDLGSLAVVPVARTTDPRLLTLLPSPGTAQLEPLESASFTVGDRGAGGYRYVSATYRVRNADEAGVPYLDPRHNLTFLAVNQAGITRDGTAISQMAKFDGSAIAEVGYALGILPTGMAGPRRQGGLVSIEPDVLQVFTEEEIGAIPAPAGVTSILPYGFVTRNFLTDSHRILDADPAADQFDGRVTFAFKVPLQASATDDPFTISGRFLAVDDDQRWITRSLEESDADAVTRLGIRRGRLSATLRAFVPGSINGAVPDVLCSLRTAGTVANPAAYLLRLAGFVSANPAPFGVGAAALPHNSSFGVTFDGIVSGASAANLLIQGFQSGGAFTGAVFGGNATPSITTPPANFLAGEDVELGVSSALSCNSGRVFRYRVQSAPAGGVFSVSASNGTATQVLLGDFNRDGHLDVASVSGPFSDIEVRLGDGAGGFVSAPSLAASNPVTLLPGDVNGDGNLDIVALGATTQSTVNVLLGTGRGRFEHAAGSPFALSSGVAIHSAALGDMNGDGMLDLAATMGTPLAVTIQPGDGTGHFGPGNQTQTGNFTNVALADLNHDGVLDAVLQGTGGSPGTSIVLGDGNGGFSAPASFSPGVVTHMAVGDLNNDGRADLVEYLPALGQVAALLGDGAGSFGPAAMLYTVPDGDIALGDINGDGRADLIMGTSDGNVRIHLSNGDGSFTESAHSPVTTGLSCAAKVKTGDLNSDGKLDIVVVDGCTAQIIVLTNDGE